MRARTATTRRTVPICNPRRWIVHCLRKHDMRRSSSEPSDFSGKSASLPHPTTTQGHGRAGSADYLFTSGRIASTTKIMAPGNRADSPVPHPHEESGPVPRKSYARRWASPRVQKSTMLRRSSPSTVLLDVRLALTVGLRRTLRGRHPLDETGPTGVSLVWREFNWLPEQPVRELPARQALTFERWRASTGRHLRGRSRDLDIRCTVMASRTPGRRWGSRLWPGGLLPR